MVHFFFSFFFICPFYSLRVCVLLYETQKIICNSFFFIHKKNKNYINFSILNFKLKTKIYIIFDSVSCKMACKTQAADYYLLNIVKFSYFLFLFSFFFLFWIEFKRLEDYFFLLKRKDVNFCYTKSNRQKTN